MSVRLLATPLLLATWMIPGTVLAQAEFREDESLADDRPEAWAMRHAAAATAFTAFGATPALAAGQWRLALDVAQVPHLDRRQRTVGFRGTKLEDLNKSPVFGRLRGRLGLPGGWIAELGYTPPLDIDGARARDLVAVAIGRRLLERDGFTVSARAFGQSGRIEGDITCPAELAGHPDALANPYGCEAPSRDRVRLHYHGLDMTAAWQRDAWSWHATAGAMRTESAVQVDALTHGVRDRSRLSSHAGNGYLAIGGSRRLATHWWLAAEVLHVPLRVRRGRDAAREHEPFTGLRLQFGYTPRPAGAGNSSFWPSQLSRSTKPASPTPTSR